MNKRPPYLLGLLCVLPLIGAFVGIFMVFYGIFKYKDRTFIVIGSIGIVITVIVYSFLFYNLRYGKATAKAFAGIAQTQINSLVKHIEFYKIQYGAYPDNLEQVVRQDETVMIKDPLLLRKANSNSNFYYKKSKERYLLFSVGEDGIANTNDDIYPLFEKSDTNLFKFIRKREGL
ncbi:type II secretion system protein GspG [Filimonas effusa]|uniref:Type II secretion system protein GspG C-terminal domain-containing protein n=1 Tax=Filimonas effusa TaxID=2508721 RepID=A0A4Q1D2H9_9BACT|nr:type II secretion system protein GspG [Filimonas effusa]RXK81427.1 hypothetical protein ESB13_21070 [Filimonas effusa]